MPDMDKLLSAIDAAEVTAYGSEDDSELSTHRSLAIDAFDGKNLEPAPEGRSQVVDRTVFETIQWILPSLTRIFANGDNVVEFEPTGPEDEESAEQESDSLNYYVTQKNNWFMTCLTWFQDALLTKNAYCMAYMEEKLHTEVERYLGQSEEAVTLLLDDDVELIGQNAYVDENDTEHYIDPQSGQEIPQEQLEQYIAQGGQPIVQPPRTLYDVELRRTKAKQQLQFKVLPPERVKVDGYCDDFTTKSANYFEYFDHVTISDLRSEGFDVADDIEADPDSDTMEDDARDVYDMERDGGEDIDPSLRVVKARTIWIRYDYDGDGIAELQKVVRVGNEILSHEPASRIPVASIVPFINTHRHMGNSVADLVFDIQRIKTFMLRAGIDSLALALNPRNAVSEKVNMNDLLVSRPGGAVRLKDGAIPGEGHILPLITQNVFPDAQVGLQHMDTVVESRVGVNRIFQGIDESQLNDHNRIGQLSTMAAQRVEQIARLFGNGVEYLFSLAHELLIKSGHSGETIRLRGKWTQIDPSQWRTGRDMRIVAPFAAGNKDSLIQRLMILGQVQEKMLAGRLRTVDEQNVYNLAKEVASAADLQGDKFFTDPSTVPPKEPPPDYTMLALQIEDKKADNSAVDSQTDAEVNKYQTDIQAQIDKYRADLQAEVQVTLARINAGEKADLERVKADLQAQKPEFDNKELRRVGADVEGINKQLSDAVNRAYAEIARLEASAGEPKEIVRDKAGKVVGVKQGGKVRKVRRGKDGRVEGLE